jgi:hypothetical protein
MRATLSGLLTGLLSGLLALSLLTALTMLAASPADARSGPDRRACVTGREYARVHVGAPAWRAVRILDGRGSPGDLGQVYRLCRGGHVVVAFSGVPAIVTLKYRLAAGSDPWG